jgi:hypothetical protein
MSYRLHINGSRCPLNSGTLCRQKTRPEIVLQFTASVKTLSITATLSTENTQKVGFVRRPISHLMSDRLSVNGNQCFPNSGTPRRRKTRPEIVFPVTTSVTTLFHNRHVKYRKDTESRLRSTTDQPSYVMSTSYQRQSMPLKFRHPMPRKTRPELVLQFTASVTTLFHNRYDK